MKSLVGISSSIALRLKEKKSSYMIKTCTVAAAHMLFYELVNTSRERYLTGLTKPEEILHLRSIAVFYKSKSSVFLVAYFLYRAFMPMLRKCGQSYHPGS